MQAPDFDPGEPVYRYTRAQAIDDGVLVDLSGLYPDLVTGGGIKLHAAMTSTAYADAVWPLDDERACEQLKASGESDRERLRRVVAAFVRTLRQDMKHALAAQASPGEPAREDSDRLAFAVTVLHAPGDWREIDLQGHIGAGDDGRPVLTLMLPCED